VRIDNLFDAQSQVYSCNAYLIRGDWNAIGDVNTLVDVGRDPNLVARVRDVYTGVGKRGVEQVILTHEHFDHVGLLPEIREAFQPLVYAHSLSVGADRFLEDGQFLRCGDRTFEVIYSPGHSNDSICLHCEAEGVLFVGDAPVVVRSADSSHEPGFVAALERICRKKVQAIYFGHGAPVLEGAQQLLWDSLAMVLQGARLGR
jgi:glyoxylase-like metal-dependent hydrolase (beta-lactamase superfamily II)